MARQSGFLDLLVRRTLAVTGLASLNGGAIIPTGKTLVATDDKSITVNGSPVLYTERRHFNIPAGSSAGDYAGLFFIADQAFQVVAFTERHATAGNDAGAVTLMLKKVPSGTARAAGTDMLTAGVSLKATADTNQSGTLHGTAANLQLAAGDALGLVLTGTPTAVAGVSGTVYLKRI